MQYVEQVVAALRRVALITLDGHSLGGAIAQLLGETTGFATTAFNAPGTQQLYASLSDVLDPVMELGVNYRIADDVVSWSAVRLGKPIRSSGRRAPNPSLVRSSVRR